jgi:hypothetical protein
MIATFNIMKEYHDDKTKSSYGPSITASANRKWPQTFYPAKRRWAAWNIPN